MRFPFALTRSMAAYLLRKRLAGQRRFPLVLMLEPLHACNLSCSGCGRIREYAAWAGKQLSIDECAASAEQCGAPIVSICGGEPLMYPGLETLIEHLIAQGKYVYVCTNGLLLRKKLGQLRPSRWLSLNVHVDGMEATHDRLVERQGVFAEAIEGIKAAKAAGFAVCTNTTVYQQTDMDEIAVLFEYLTALGVDGLMISPAYPYHAVQTADPEGAGQLFMTRQEIQAKFRLARKRLARFKLVTSPIYLEFLCGQRELACAAWANPTRNVCGWRSPCYLLADTHYATYRQLVEATAWDRLGPGNDPRCDHCLVHCGFEPAAVFSAAGLRDRLRMAIWQMT